MATQFVNVYNRFLGKITDDMYVTLTPEDTLRDLRNLLIEALPGFEFPRFNAFAYTIAETEKTQEEVLDTEDLDIYIIKKMLSEYKDNIVNRYNITSTEDVIEIFDQIGKKIGAVRQFGDSELLQATIPERKI